MKSAIRMFAAFVILGSAAGCGQDAKTATILPPDGSTGSKASPATADKGTDEIVAPKSATPPAVSPEPSTPPALPTPPKAPETTPPSEGSKSAKAAPETPVISYVAPTAPIFIPLAPRATKHVMSLTDLHTVECVNCSTGGEDHGFRCPANYVVTGFRFGTEDFLDVESLSETKVVGGLDIVCSRLDQDHVHDDDITFAKYFEFDAVTREPRDVTHAGTPYELESAVNCPIADGAATGVIGRSGVMLDSFGLTCGLYLNNDTFTGVFPAAKETLTGGESVYGGMPGNGGKAFDATCDVNEVIVGLNVSNDDNFVFGINSLTCAKVARVDVK